MVVADALAIDFVMTRVQPRPPGGVLLGSKLLATGLLILLILVLALVLLLGVFLREVRSWPELVRDIVPLLLVRLRCCITHPRLMGAAMILAATRGQVSPGQGRSLAVGRKRAMASIVLSVMPSPSCAHSAAIFESWPRRRQVW